MTSFRNRYDAKRRKDALSLLKSIQKRIQDGEVLVDTFGAWEGTPGTITIKIVVKENENSRKLSNY